MICASLFLASIGVGAKSMKDLLVSMPDSLVPYLDKNLRLEFAELQEIGVKAEVKNLLGENSVMDTLTADFVQIRLSQAATMQIKKLPWLGAPVSGDASSVATDSLLCMVRTFAAPEKESEVYLYRQDWQPLDASRLFDGKSLAGLAESLVQKSDTMSLERFLELKKMVEPQMVSAMLFEHENSIVVRLALPLLSAEDKKAVNIIKLQRKFNWNGKVFKEG